MTLTAEQIRLRAGKLTSSRIKALMTGDAEKLLQLYREMIGEEIEEDLSGVWPVRLGEATEALNLEWYERRNNCVLTRQGEVVVHPHYDWAAATLDGWDSGLHCPVEAKCVGGREPLEVVIDRYQPQLQWQMEVTGAKQCALSVIVGANEPIVEYIDRDDPYANEMVSRGKQFMSFVERRVPPVVLPPVPTPIIATKTYDLSTNNRWVDSAFAWLETKSHAERYKDAEKVLKSLVPDDAKKCFGAGVRITKDKANRLSLREDTHESIPNIWRVRRD